MSIVLLQKRGRTLFSDKKGDAHIFRGHIRRKCVRPLFYQTVYCAAFLALSPEGTPMFKPIIRAVALSIAAAAAMPLHAAQGGDPAPKYPDKPVRMIVPFAPGAGTDTTARTIAQKLSEKWGQQFVVDNRTGAGGV